MLGIKELISVDINIVEDAITSERLIALGLVFVFKPEIYIEDEKVTGCRKYTTYGSINDTEQSRKAIRELSSKSDEDIEIYGDRKYYGLGIDFHLARKVQATAQIFLSDKTNRKMSIEIQTDGNDKIKDYSFKLLKGDK